jgi:hypothetical protein
MYETPPESNSCLPSTPVSSAKLEGDALFWRTPTNWRTIFITKLSHHVRINAAPFIRQTEEILAVASTNSLNPPIMASASTEVLLAVSILHAVKVGDVCEVSISLQQTQTLLTV